MRPDDLNDFEMCELLLKPDHSGTPPALSAWHELGPAFVSADPASGTILYTHHRLADILANAQQTP